MLVTSFTFGVPIWDYLIDTITQLHWKIFFRVIEHYYCDSITIMPANKSATNASMGFFPPVIPILGPIRQSQQFGIPIDK